MKNLYLTLFFIALSTLYLRAQTILVENPCGSTTSFNSDNNVPFIKVAEGSKIKITLKRNGSMGNVCSSINRGGITLDGNNSERSFEINSVNTSHQGYYASNCLIGNINFEFVVLVIPQPEWYIHDLPAFCYGLQHQPTANILTTGPTGSYDWRIETSNDGNNFTPYTGAANTGNFQRNSMGTTSFQMNTMVLRNTINTLSPVPQYVRYFTLYTNSDGCKWTKHKDFIKHTEDPIIMVNPPTGTIAYVVGTAPLDMSAISVQTPSGINRTSFTSETVSGPGVSGGQFIYPLTAGNHTMTYTINYQGCEYREEFTVNATGNISQSISFLNEITPQVSSTREVCIGDVGQFSYTASSNELPKYITFKGLSDTVWVMGIEEWNPQAPGPIDYGSTTITSPSLPAPAANNITYIYLTNVHAKYSYDSNNNNVKVYFKTPDFIRSGSVNIYKENDVFPNNPYKAAGTLVVNIPILDFYPNTSPICSSSEIVFVGVPSGGTYSARVTSLNMTELTPPYGNPTFTGPSDVGAFDMNKLRKAFLQLPLLENNGGKLVEVTYSYRPSYMNGVYCPDGFYAKKVKLYPVFNNEPLSLSFPIIELDPNNPSTAPFILNDRVVIRPELISTPAEQAVISGPEDLKFTGTWVQNQVRNTTDTVQVFNRANVNGDYTVELTVNNNGCRITGTGSITVIDKATFHNLSSEVCRQAGIMHFNRPLGMNYTANVDGRSMDYLIDLNGFYAINSLTVNEQFKLVRLDVYDPAGSTSVPIATSTTPNSGISVTAPNTSSESFTIDLQHPAFNSLSSIRVVGVFESSRQSYVPLPGYSSWSTLPTVSDMAYFTPISSPLDYAIRTTSEQTCTFRTELTAVLSGLPPYFCEGSTPVTAITMLSGYDMTQSRLTIRPSGQPVSPSNVTLSSANIEASNFTAISPHQNEYTIRYENNRIPGCPITGEINVTFIPKVNMSLNLAASANNSLCKNADAALLNIIPAVGTIPTHTGILDSLFQYYFKPTRSSVYPGRNDINLRHTDNYGCATDTTISIEVLALPNIALQVENSNTAIDREYNICPNADSVGLQGYYNNAPLPYPTANARFFGDGVVDNFLKSQLIVGGLSEFYIYMEYTDANACTNTDSLKIKMRAFPILSLVASNNTALPLSVCANAAPIAIMGVDAMNTTGAVSTSTLRGRGVVNPQGGSLGVQSRHATYSIVQALASYADTTGIRADTVTFIHGNQFGCVDTLEYIFTIDTVIKPIINNLAPHYCIDAGATSIQVTPLPSQVSNGVTIEGYGVSQQGHSDYIVLDPTLAYDSAGINNFNVSYKVTGANLCIGEAIASTKIVPLPTAIVNIPTNICLSGNDELIDVRPNNNASYTVTSDSLNFFTYNSADDKYYMTPRLLPNTNAAIPYTLHIHLQDPVYGCSDVVSRQVLVNPRPAIDIQNMDDEHLVCSNGGVLNINGFPLSLSSSNAYFTSNLPGNHFLSSGSTARIELDNTLSGQNFEVNYHYTDVYSCTEIKTKHIYITPAPTIDIISLDSAYCRVPTDSILLQANSAPTNAAVTFSGQGVFRSGSDYFLQLGLTMSGNNIITAKAEVSNNVGGRTISCMESEDITVRINPLPIPHFVGVNQNEPFCSTHDTVHLSAIALNGPPLEDYRFYGAIVDTQITLLPLPNNPSLYAPQITYFLDFTAADSNRVEQEFKLWATTTEGCVDSVDITVKVHQSPETYFTAPGLDPNITAQTQIIEICDSENGISFVGTPATGIFSIVNQSPTSSSILQYGSFYSPNIDYINNVLPGVQYDTILYTVVTEVVCTTYHSKVIKINPIPRPSMIIWSNEAPARPITQACIGEGPFSVAVAPLGGTFVGGGIRNNLFSPDIVGLGSHDIRYEYTDPLTSCSHYDSVVVRVSSTPYINLTPDGACANSNVTINLENLRLNLVYDSISAVRWLVLPNTILPATYDSMQVQPLSHRFTAGEHHVVLEVTNNGYCVGTDTLRLLVNEHITLASDPLLGRDSLYLQPFEANNGGWHHEMKHEYRESDIWRWGSVSRSNPMFAGNSTNFWSTTAQSYAAAHDGWVYSPCFDIRDLDRPMISLDYFIHADAGNDGAVIEYYHRPSDTWKPLGRKERGINWYNAVGIGGSPGDQITSPIGWSEKGEEWKNARYVLDSLKQDPDLRFRIAFGALRFFDTATVNYQGFAFDNFMVRDRKKNVLLFHYSNMEAADMNRVNNIVYNHIYNRHEYPLDLSLIQVHTDQDALFQSSYYPDAHLVLKSKYGAFAGDLVVNGIFDRSEPTRSQDINAQYYEKQILQAPHFFIDIDSFIFNNYEVRYTYTIKPNPAFPINPQDGFYIHSAIVTDSVPYPYRPYEKVHALLNYWDTRGDRIYPQREGATTAHIPDNGISISKRFDVNLQGYPQIPRLNSHLIVWIERDAINTVDQRYKHEILQSGTSRNVLEFLHNNPIAVDEATEEFAHQVLESKLYPNPTYDFFNVDFLAPLAADCTWKLYDIRGVLLQEGILPMGTTQTQVQVNDYAAGVYIYSIEHKDFRVSTRIMVHRP